MIMIMSYEFKASKWNVTQTTILHFVNCPCTVKVNNNKKNIMCNYSHGPLQLLVKGLSLCDGISLAVIKGGLIALHVIFLHTTHFILENFFVKSMLQWWYLNSVLFCFILAYTSFKKEGWQF